MGLSYSFCATRYYFDAFQWLLKIWILWLSPTIQAGEDIKEAGGVLSYECDWLIHLYLIGISIARRATAASHEQELTEGIEWG